MKIRVYCLNRKDNNSLLNSNFEHIQSKSNIRNNYDYIKAWLEKKQLQNNGFQTYILEKLSFVLVTSTKLDDAFIFFDSQNSRGKSLERHDLLKAHHLRYVYKNEYEHKVSEECAKYWESIDKRERVDDKICLGYLINSLLGRMRKWSRADYNKLDVLEEFKSQRISPDDTPYYKMNHYHQPPIFKEWRYILEEEKANTLELKFRDIDAWYGTKRLKFISESKKHMPFQIIQPLEGGEQFFWFVEKYDHLYNELFVENNKKISGLFKKLKMLLNSMSYNTGIAYINAVFEGSMLFYYDKFGLDQFDEIALWLVHGLYYLRLRQASVHYASITKFIREDFNPIKIIHEAAYPQHIIREIKNFTEDKKYSLLDNISGIRKTFFDKLYAKEGFLKNQGDILPESIKKIQEAITI